MVVLKISFRKDNNQQGHLGTESYTNTMNISVRCKLSGELTFNCRRNSFSGVTLEVFCFLGNVFNKSLATSCYSTMFEIPQLCKNKRKQDVLALWCLCGTTIHLNELDICTFQEWNNSRHHCFSPPTRGIQKDRYICIWEVGLSDTGLMSSWDCHLKVVAFAWLWKTKSQTKSLGNVFFVANTQHQKWLLWSPDSVPGPELHSIPIAKESDVKTGRIEF